MGETWSKFMPFDAPPPSPAEVLGFIKERFATGKWKWGPYAVGSDAICLTDALWNEGFHRGIYEKYEECEECDLPEDLWPPETNLALAYLAEAIIAIPGDTEEENRNIVENWNDEDGRTLDEILGLLDEAIELARE